MTAETATKRQPLRVRIHCTATGHEGWITRATIASPWTWENGGGRLDDLIVSLSRILEVDDCQ